MGMGLSSLLLALQMPFFHPVDMHPMPQPHVATSAWEYDVKCAAKIGAHVVPGGDLKDIKWFTGKMHHGTDGVIIGVWLPPDTIILDERVTEVFDVVAHEMLHQLLHMTDPRVDAHPVIPFYFPCYLAYEHMGKWNDSTGVLTLLRSGIKLYPRKEQEDQDP